MSCALACPLPFVSRCTALALGQLGCPVVACGALSFVGHHGGLVCLYRSCVRQSSIAYRQAYRRSSPITSSRARMPACGRSSNLHAAAYAPSLWHLVERGKRQVFRRWRLEAQRLSLVSPNGACRNRQPFLFVAKLWIRSCSAASGTQAVPQLPSATRTTLSRCKLATGNYHPLGPPAQGAPARSIEKEREKERKRMFVCVCERGRQ